jgi:hypothetical protein
MTDATELLRAIESSVRAILMMQVEQAKNEERPKGRGSIEGLLFRAGFTAQKDIVAITGTPKSTVSDRLKEEGLK